MLGTDDTAAENAGTSLLYAGEQYDSELDHYYLRARYYNPWSGTFNRMDDFAGNNQDPQSLHKYLYCHNNPINGIDPSGRQMFNWVGFNLLTLLVVVAILVVAFVICYRFFRPLRMMSGAQPIDQEVLADATVEMRRNWWKNESRHRIKEKMKKLADWVESPEYSDLGGRVRTINSDEDSITGLNFDASPYLYVSQQVVENRNALEVAIVIFAEWQHHPEGGGFGEQEAMDEFVVMRRQIPNDLRTEWINSRRHGGTENVQ
jgi:RHS repeat-associated protein